MKQKKVHVSTCMPMHTHQHTNTHTITYSLIWRNRFFSLDVLERIEELQLIHPCVLQVRDSVWDKVGAIQREKENWKDWLHMQFRCLIWYPATPEVISGTDNGRCSMLEEGQMVERVGDGVRVTTRFLGPVLSIPSEWLWHVNSACKPQPSSLSKEDWTRLCLRSLLVLNSRWDPRHK